MSKHNQSRRSFLKSSALVGGTAILAPTILSSCAKGANDRINIAHIGVGSMGGATIKSWLLPLEEAYSVATCDPFEKRRNNWARYINNNYKKKGIAAPECKAYLNMDEILERSDIDAVNITTPDHWHVPAAIKAARAGKHILLAKPLGLSYKHFKLLENEVESNGVKFHYGTQQRSMAHMKMAIEAIKNGEIGEVTHAEAYAPGRAGSKNPIYSPASVPEGFDYDLWTGPAKMNPYFTDRVTNISSWFQYDYSIGFLGGWGAHPLDILVMGVKDKIDGRYTCEGTGTFWQGDGIYNTVNSWDLYYKYESGFSLRFSSVNFAKDHEVHPHRKVKDGNSTTFFGEKGWISVGRGSAESNIPEIQARFESLSNVTNGKVKNDSYKTGQDFVNVIKGRCPETNPLDDAIISDCISHMGDIALREGRQITWDPERGEIIANQQANLLLNRNLREPYNV